MVDLYDAARSLGVFKAYLGLIITGIIGFILLIISVSLLFRDDSHLVDTRATITRSDCERKNIENNVTYDCDLDVNYNVENDTYTGRIMQTSNIPLNVNNKIFVTYDKNEPSNVTPKQLRSKTTALILFIIALILVGFSGFNYFMSTRFSLYAAAQGTATTANILTRGFR